MPKYLLAYTNILYLKCFTIPGMKAIPTSTRNLICDGFWKYVCHPNYTGDLMIALSFSLPGG